MFRIDFHVSGYLNFDKKNSICSLKFSILLFMETALKRLIFHNCHFSNVWSWSIRQISANPIFIFLSLIVSIQKQNSKIGCHFYRVFSQDQLKWIFYLSPTAHAQSGHWWLLQKNNSRIYFLQRCNSVNALIRLIESNKQ